MDGPSDLHRRARRTRDSIVEAFVRLALEQRYDTIRTADLIASAAVGRSTFYEHFRGKDEILVAAMEPVLLPLANAALASTAHVRSTLDHVWRQRAFARIVLAAGPGMKLQRRLAAMIETRLDEIGPEVAPPAMMAMAAAAGQLTMLRMWVSGEAACPSAVLARQMSGWSRFLTPDSPVFSPPATASSPPDAVTEAARNRG